jgi:hypothetical protein
LGAGFAGWFGQTAQRRASQARTGAVTAANALIFPRKYCDIEQAIISHDLGKI